MIRQTIKRKTILLVVMVTVILLFAVLFLTYFLPKKSNIPISLQVGESTPIAINCPVAQDLCSMGKKIKVDIEDSDENSTWIAFNLPNLVPILAVFDGHVKREILPLEDDTSFNLITLTSKNGKYSAQYLFISKTIITGNKKQEINEGEVKKGQAVGLIEGFPITQNGESNEYNLHFNISLVDNGTPLEIPVENIDNVILP